MPIFASTTFAPLGSRVTDVLGLMLEHGLHRIELGSTHCYEDGLLERLRRTGVEYLLHNYFPPPVQPFVLNLASLDDAIRQRSVEHALASITFASRLDARLYTVHPGFLADPVSASRSKTNYDFLFGVGEPGAGDYERAFEKFVASVQVLAEHARAMGVQVAIESEGSVSKRQHLLFQAPEEFERFFGALPDPVVGINLNIGHLNLAANAFGFDRLGLIDRIAHRVMAIEISHNEGAEDEHRPLVAGAWYWSIVRDPRFARVPIILECRDSTIEAICESVGNLEAEHVKSATAEQVS